MIGNNSKSIEYNKKIHRVVTIKGTLINYYNEFNGLRFNLYKHQLNRLIEIEKDLYKKIGRRYI